MVESRHTMKLKRMLRRATTAPPSFLSVSRALMAHLHVSFPLEKGITDQKQMTCTLTRVFNQSIKTRRRIVAQWERHHMDVLFGCTTAISTNPDPAADNRGHKSRSHSTLATAIPVTASCLVIEIKRNDPGNYGQFGLDRDLDWET
ncbi:hypothetical protein DAPPUDRAFT_105072 [Daphnia pulex]|uniref:Uncharacterized protein n=1 Tax=Daphnia pulex TaxID=6669 RepID=E9GPB9_DAPPU|nr:hypothetical protein DAPPUDRAFT_105072 [Daphnia pulex]|eukprot:EFX78614.1 hypothetical protein DAPPUDRAFT_105072 [Daphnia pulex]